MLNIKAILAALAGLVVVGGVGTYVFLENSKPVDEPIEVSTGNEAEPKSEDVSADNSASASASTETESENAADESAAEDASKATEAATAEPTQNWQMPAFDVLRVEPDGSTVIAGRGEPNTTLKIMNGDEVLSEVKIGSTGDFAVIFDEPLNSGDYQLSLKVEDENGNSLVSEETAVVSVPEDASGQLLAMVTKPGEASRILAQPEAETEVAAADATAPADVAKAAGEKAMEVATDAAKEATDKVANAAETVTKAAKEEVAALAEKAGEAAEMAKDMVSEGAEKQMDAEKPAEVAAASDTEITQTEGSDQATSNDDGTASQSAEKMSKDEATGDASNSDVSENKEMAAKEEKAADASVETAAKETEMAKEDSATMAADDKTQASEPKVDAVVRIEAVEVEGDKLFVAGVATKGNKVRILVDDEEVGVVDVTPEGRFLIETKKELSVGQHMIVAALEDGKTKEIVLQAVVPFDRPETESAAAIASNDAGNESAAPQTETEAQPASEADAAPSENKEMAAKETDVADASQKEGEPATIVQDSLTPAATQSVIIRKGDTLWQIARRTYGAGVRYTTIYLANQEQIQNPDRISPGQVFSVPEEALENAEELHRRRLQGN